jgi:hypothetical protein
MVKFTPDQRKSIEQAINSEMMLTDVHCPHCYEKIKKVAIHACLKTDIISGLCEEWGETFEEVLQFVAAFEVNLGAKARKLWIAAHGHYVNERGKGRVSKKQIDAVIEQAWEETNDRFYGPET